MNILNLYAGIGGNRKLWGNEHNIIAVEYDEKIANVYKEFFPKDTVIVDDAHEYLLKHYKEFDFIWSSPPCVTHSKLILGNINTKWVIENVKPYYKPLIEPSFNIGRHNFWSSDFILTIQRTLNHSQIRNNRNLLAKSLGFDINHLKNKNIDVRQVLRNCVEPEIGKYIFNQITS